MPADAQVRAGDSGPPGEGVVGALPGERERTFPPANAVHDWLGRFQDEAAAAKRERGKAMVPEPATELQLMECVSWRLAGGLIQTLGLEELTLDLDATVLASGKREALPTYRSATGAVPGERGYQPLSVFCPELGMVLGTEFRDGNVPASKRNLELLERVLSNLPAEIKWVGVRSDGAAHQKKLIRFFNDPASRPEPLRRFGVIGFVIGVPQDAQMREALAQTPASW